LEAAADQVIDDMAKSPYSYKNPLEAPMASKSDDVFRQQARVLKVLANESRLKIIERLSRKGCALAMADSTRSVT
jgi:hypothetical protein